MQTTDILKRQIQTATDLEGVVRTMKTLAAVNIRQFEAAARSLEDYSQTLQQAVAMLLWNDAALSRTSPTPDTGRAGLIVFGSDQGMCGGFNEVVADFVDRQLQERDFSDPSIPVMALGRRLAARLADAGHVVDDTIELPSGVAGITLMLQDLLPKVDQWRQEHRLRAVHVCHNRRKTQTRYETVMHKLLPVSPRDLTPQPPRRWSGRSLPMITLESRSLWRALARQFVFVSLFQACAESQASENAARIAAMQAAETHIHERLDELNVDYQQLRQTSITEELLDVITGFEAIEASTRHR